MERYTNQDQLFAKIVGSVHWEKEGLSKGRKQKQETPNLNIARGRFERSAGSNMTELGF